MFTFRQSGVNGCDLRAGMLVSKLKTACTTFGVLIAVKIALKCRNSYNRREITLRIRQNRVSGYDLRAAAPVSKLKTVCTTFGV